MKMAIKSYPHPVLNNGDDMEGEFSSSVHVQLDDEGENWLVEVTCNLKSETLSRLIKEGSATYIADIESPNCFYRMNTSFESGRTKILIPVKKVRDKINLHIYIIATKAIADYLPAGSHKDYSGTKFSVSRGDILADGSQVILPADPLFDPMTSTPDSFLKIDEDTSGSPYVWFDVQEDIICIYLPKKDWEEYTKISGQDVATTIFHSSIALPMLTAAIEDSRDEVVSKTKNIKLARILETRGLNSQDAEIAAQEILGLPISRAISALGKIE